MSGLKLACALGKFGRLFVGILIVVVGAPLATAEVTVLWDEATDGDLSNEMGSPTMLTIDQPGDEIYETYQVWEAYRRNDPSNHFRIGEMQAESTAELIFVFE